MNNQFVAVLFLAVGIVIGWSVRPYLAMSNRTSHLTSQNTPSKGWGSAVIEDARFSNELPLNSEHAGIVGNANVEPVIASSPPENLGFHEVKLVDLIEKQDVEGTLEVLSNEQVDLVQHPKLLRVLHNNFFMLHQQENWRTLGLWVQELLANGYDLSVVHLMDAKIHIHQGDMLASLEALFLSKHYAETTEEADNRQIDIENLIVNSMNQYRSESNQSGYKTVYPILQYVMEKQPDNPLFGIEMSILYADGGDLQKAIETLNLVPYTEKYQEMVVSLKTQWLNALNPSEEVTTAIPLEQMGQHYRVTAIANQERHLNLIIDTGATTTALSKEAIQFLKDTGILQYREGSVAIRTANGSAEADYYRLDFFSIGEYAVDNFELLEVELSGADQFDGLLGMNFLSLFEFEIDQTNRQLFLTAKRNR